MAPSTKRTVAIITPDIGSGYRNPGEGDVSKNGKIIDDILARINAEGFVIQQRRTLQLTKKQVRQLYRHAWDDTEFDRKMEFMVSGPCVALVLEHENAVERWNSIMGPIDPVAARGISAKKPLLRGVYGTTSISNGFYGSESPLCALRDERLLFPASPELIEQAILILKPSALEFLDVISVLLEKEGFFLMDQSQHTIDSDEDLLLLSESNDPTYMDELRAIMTSGPSHVFLFEGLGLLSKLELLLGPSNPQEAALYFPMSIRAEMGSTLANNCAHILHTTPAALQRMKTWCPSYFSLSTESTLAIIKPITAELHGDSIQNIILTNGFTIQYKKNCRLSREDVMEFYAEHQGKPFYSDLMAYMTSGTVIIMVLSRVKAIYVWRKCMGPTNSMIAAKQYPNSIRGRFGIDGTRNAVHGSDSPESARREIQLMFQLPVIPLGSMSTKEFAAKPIKYLHPHKTLHSVLAKGISELTQREPKFNAMEACEWLGQFLLQESLHDKPNDSILDTKGDISMTSSKKSVDLEIPPLSELHLVGMFGSQPNVSILATQIAKDYNYHLMDMETLIQDKGANDTNLQAIIKSFKRCVWKRILVINFQPDISFFIAFQKHVAPFAWIHYVAGDESTQDHDDTTDGLPFQVERNEEKEFFEYFHRFGQLHYVAPRQSLESTLATKPFLRDVHGPFSPRFLIVNDKANCVPLDQLNYVAQFYRWVVLDYKEMLSRQITREVRTEHRIFTTYARTGEIIPLNLLIQLIHQSISISVSSHRYLMTNFPSQVHSDTFLTMLDENLHANPPTQLVWISNVPVHRTISQLPSFELRRHSVGLLDCIWIDGKSIDSHLLDIFHPILAPFIVLKIGEETNDQLDPKFLRSNGFIKFSAKDALRAEVLCGSTLGQRIHAHVQSNELIPDTIVVQILQKYFYQNLQHKYILEDFPRTADQCISFQKEICHPFLVLYYEKASIPTDFTCFRTLAASYPFYSLNNSSNLNQILLNISISNILIDFNLNEIDLNRIEKYFQKKGIIILTNLYLENIIQKKNILINENNFIDFLFEFINKRNFNKIIFLGFPRTLNEAKLLKNKKIKNNEILILKKKIIPIPHEITDEDYYSSDEEEKEQRKNATEPEIDQLVRYYNEIDSIQLKEFTFVDIQQIYPSIELLFRPEIILAIGNKASGFHSALQHAANISNCIYIHVPELIKKYIEIYPNSKKTKEIKKSFKENCLVSLEIILDLIMNYILNFVSNKIILTGFPCIIGNRMPYIHQQIAILEKEIGLVNELIHFQSSNDILIKNVTSIDQLHQYTDKYIEQSIPVVEYFEKINKKITILQDTGSYDTMVQDFQSILI